MLTKYGKMFIDTNFNCIDSFDDNINLQINGQILLAGRLQVEKYYKDIIGSLQEINHAVNEVFYSSPDKIIFSWQLMGKHVGILLGFMPTQKLLKFHGMTTLELNKEKIFKINVFYNEKALIDQITSTSEKHYKQDEIFNNLNGPAHKIYDLLLSTRRHLTDSKQALINELRKTTLLAPDLNLLNHQEINTVKASTTLTKAQINIANRSIDLFIYAPKGQESNQDLPTVLYLHGGGWCIGSPEGYDIPNRKLALTAQARVICPRYRLCPEHPYPAGFDDCCSVYLYCRGLSETNDLHLDPNKIIVAGDSVGGGFTVALTLRMKAENQPIPDGIMLLSPATDMRLENYHSYNLYTRNNMMIDQALIGFIRGAYIQGDMWDHPYVSPMRGDLSGFPKAFIMIGEDDPLYDENVVFSQKLTRSSNNGCDVLIGKGMPHHYHTFVGLADAVEEAYDRMADFIHHI